MIDINIYYIESIFLNKSVHNISKTFVYYHAFTERRAKDSETRASDGWTVRRCVGCIIIRAANHLPDLRDLYEM